MKKTAIMLTILISITVFKIDAFADNIETTAGGQKVFQSIEVSNPASFDLAGINLSKYNYSQIYRYSLVKGKILFLIGRTKSGKDELSSISLNDQKKNIIAEYSLDLTKLLPKFTVFTMNKIKESTFIVVEYAENNKKRMEVFHDRNDYNYTLLNEASIPFESKIYISDVNNDSYTDILVWGKTKSKEDINNSGEMSVMLYSPQEMTFTNLVLYKLIQDKN